MSESHGILATAIALLTTAVLWSAARGNETPLAWLLAGAGSITLGVWLGVAVTRPPGLLTERRDEESP